MTRREEVVNNIGYQVTHAAIEYIQAHEFADRIDSFEEGAEWMQKTMIEKARQWFNLHFRQVGTPKEIKHNFESKERMWKSFTQFMEE